MKIVSRLPREVKRIEHLWIPLSDGLRLAARLWLPEGAEREPVPAVLEYIPYRKRDRTRERDQPMHHYFAGHGFAALRVDVRGTGDSDGILLDEYHEQELGDGLELLRWIASQSWCNGRVGMIGKSWGGFNALQLAARQPPALRAVISVCSSDDRYRDDAHYMGGCLLTENLRWGSALMSLAALPPDPEIAGPGWRETWLRRLEAVKLFPAAWMEHPHRDAYWKRGSVCEDYGAVACAVYAVGGWADAYTNAVFRLLRGLRGPREGLVGPWAHLYPHNGVPGPAIGFLQEAVRFWKRWLLDDTGGERSESRLRVFVQESEPPRTFYLERAGRFVEEDDWPSATTHPLRLHLSSSGLARSQPERGDAPAFDVSSPQSTGARGGVWCSFGEPGDLPGDQAEDDDKSRCFDSEPLEEALEILGGPILEFSVASSEAVALLAARLNDVAPDGSSSRVSYGLLNLTHRDGHDSPSALEPGKRYRVRLRLNDVAHRFAPGHRVRLALSTCYWPIAWPPPRPTTLSVSGEGAYLELPVRAHRDESEPRCSFPPPESGPEADAVDLHEHTSSIGVERDASNGRTVTTIVSGLRPNGEPAVTRFDAIGVEVGHGVSERYEIDDDEPTSARAEIGHLAVIRFRDTQIRVELKVSLHSTREAFRLEAGLEAHEGSDSVFSRSWDESVPRNLN